MKKIWNWLLTSNRWKHLMGGVVLGGASDSWYCAGLVGVSVGGALEWKDRAHGGEFDWVDLSMTVVGAVVGYGVQCVVH